MEHIIVEGAAFVGILLLLAATGAFFYYAGQFLLLCLGTDLTKSAAVLFIVLPLLGIGALFSR